MKLFELKQELAEYEREAKVLRAKSLSSGLDGEGRIMLDHHESNAANLRKQIAESESNNTLRGRVGPFAVPSSGTDAEQPERVPNSVARFRGASFKDAMKQASATEREEVRAFSDYIAGDMNALASLVPSGDGGVFIPTIIVGTVARNYSAFSPVRDNATIWSTPHGEPATFPVVSDSESATILAPAALTGLDDVVSGDTPPTAITGPLMNAYKFSSKPVFAPRELVTDANLDVLEEMLSALLARITRLQNSKYTKGTGSGEPRGFLTDATAYEGGSVALDLDIALDLAYSVPAMYRPNGIYMASDLTIKYLRKLKTGLSGDKRELWKDAFEDGNASQGTPAKLHGYPIFVNNDMDSVATDGTFANISPLAFGNFKRFVVREAENGGPYVYRYPVPAKDGSAVIAFKRSDSKLLVSTAISKLTT